MSYKENMSLSAATALTDLTPAGGSTGANMSTERKQAAFDLIVK